MTPLTHEESATYAVHCWLDLGLSSRTHPVIAYALREFLEPIGVSADSFEIPAMDMIVTGMNGAKLINPRFSLQKIDWDRPAVRAFMDFRTAREGLNAVIDGRGNLTLKIRKGMEGDMSLKVLHPLIESEGLVDAVKAAFDDAVLFVVTACRLIADDDNDDIIGSFNAGQHAHFCELVVAYLREALIERSAGE